MPSKINLNDMSSICINDILMNIMSYQCFYSNIHSMIVQSCQNNIILFYPPKGFEAVTFEMKGMNNNIFKNPSQANDRINTVNIHCKHNFIVGKNALWCQFNALISM